MDEPRPQELNYAGPATPPLPTSADLPAYKRYSRKQLVVRSLIAVAVCIMLLFFGSGLWWVFVELIFHLTWRF